MTAQVTLCPFTGFGAGRLGAAAGGGIGSVVPGIGTGAGAAGGAVAGFVGGAAICQQIKKVRVRMFVKKMMNAILIKNKF